MKVWKNEDEVGGNAVYETTRVRSRGYSVSSRVNVKCFRNAAVSQMRLQGQLHSDGVIN